MRLTGRRSVVVQGQTDSLTVRVLDSSGAEVTTQTDSSTITIYDTAGAELVAATAISSVSGAVATYSREWASTTFELDKGYRAHWKVYASGGGSFYEIDTYFEVVLRRFYSQLTDSDLATAMRPSGVTSFSAYRQTAWDEITNFLWKKLKRYPGNIFYPEDFFSAHQYLTLAESYLFNAFGSQVEEDWTKYEELRKRAMEILDQASSSVEVDVDEDQIMDGAEEEFFLSGSEIIR